MLINLRNALMSGKRLPYDAEVEFLQSTGTQYIDTGFNADRSTVVKCAFSVVSRATNGYVVWGAGKGDGASGLYDAVALAEKYNNPSTLHLLDTYNNNNAQSISYGQDLLVDCVLSDGSITINGTTTSHNYYTLNRTADYPIWVFGENLAGNLFRPSKIKLIFLQIWQNGVLFRDYIPVRRGTTGYLYDRVSGKLFGNAGSGDFVLGPDVVPVEYIESHGTEYINTGIILNDTYGIDINFAPMETASGVSEHGIFGSSVSGTGIRHNVLQIHSSANGVGLWMPSNTRICNYAITIGEYQHWQINLSDSDEVVVDNVLKAYTHPTTPAECQYPVYLFGRNVANTLKSGSCSKMRLATWKVCDGSGNPIQKWLPVRVSTEGAMMDVLTRRIYRNAGTGAFGYGNDLKYPIPAE